MAYDACNAIIVQNDAESSAAEAHGLATGLLCADGQAGSATWLAELLRDNGAMTEEHKNLLARLFEETRRLMASDEFEFDLFLPEDETPLSARVEALGDWCGGFLLGVGLGASTSSWSREARDIVKDIAEFTKLDAGAEGEEDERAFVEITEYLRSAVLLLRDELAGGDGGVDLDGEQQ